MARHFEGLESFAQFAESLILKMEAVPSVAAAMSDEILYEKAHAIYGDASKLAELSPATQEERERLGYSANEPLKRTGELLQDNLEKGHEGPLAGIGSDEPVQLYSEYGFLNARTGTAVPPRPVIRIAMAESTPQLMEIAQRAAGIGLGFGPVHIKANSLQEAGEIAQDLHRVYGALELEG